MDDCEFEYEWTDEDESAFEAWQEGRGERIEEHEEEEDGE